MIMNGPKSSCDCCGICCRQGGPALHDEDLDLISANLLGFDDLVTIRQGEMLFMPLADHPEPAGRELIKIKGKEGSWCCKFLDDKSSTCTIYQNRPLACRLLKCWDPEEILKISGKKLLGRFDLIVEDDPVSVVARQFEQQFPVPDMLEIQDKLRAPGQRDNILEMLRDMIVNELRFRDLTVRRFELTSSRELFYFGRPLFQLIVPMGVTMRESQTGLSLIYKNT